MEKVAIIGASRGLGAAIVRTAPENHAILALARNQERLQSLQKQMGPRLDFQALDVTAEFEAVLHAVQTFGATKVFYLAGGGPYGSFQDKDWKDHLWAWEVTFLAAARLVHALLRQTLPPQIVLCGSSIAEDKGDPRAASYASAKHALKGLYETLKLENAKVDVRLFSPGYLDTELLPKGAAVRYKGVWNPEEVAKRFWDWVCSNDHAGHMSLSSHPDT
jgi:short-subunit dehydrogenase